jgi:AcrR family transcriptional regulator
MAGKQKKKTKSRTVTARLPSQERERQIIQGAVRFFAEIGFGGDMRELAKRLGITHPLLFRYFRNKEALLEKIYQEVFLSRWDPTLEVTIRDRSRTMRDRLFAFYWRLGEIVLNYEWVRLAMYAGLKGLDYHARMVAFTEERYVKPICAELRVEFGLPCLKEIPPKALEIELVRGLSFRIFFIGVRQFIYGTPGPVDLDALIKAEIEVFFDGASTVYPNLVGTVNRRRKGS